jgi:glycosyltransferase involved in cell wall biosynthesis
MLLSIITINYNNLAGLQKTMESVLGQTNQAFEYIVIDGGSTDGSKEYIQSKSQHLAYWVSEKDGGIYSAMNKGIGVANGEYLLFLNSGDWLYNTSITELVQPVLAEQYDFVTGKIINVEPDGTQSVPHLPKKVEMSFFFFAILYHQSTFMKRDIFKLIGGYDEHYKISGDWEFYIRAIKYGYCNIKTVDTIISYFDCTGVSSDKNLKQSITKDRIDIFKKYFPLFSDDYADLIRLRKEKEKTIQAVIKWQWKKLKGFSRSKKF